MHHWWVMWVKDLWKTTVDLWQRQRVHRAKIAFLSFFLIFSGGIRKTARKTNCSRNWISDYNKSKRFNESRHHPFSNAEVGRIKQVNKKNRKVSTCCGFLEVFRVFLFDFLFFCIAALAAAIVLVRFNKISLPKKMITGRLRNVFFKNVLL